MVSNSATQTIEQPVDRSGDERLTGADNLLLGCAGVTGGAKVLFLNETGKRAIDPGAVSYLEERARELGAEVRSLWAGPVAGPESIPAELIAAIAASDVTIFNHNLGATLRFEPVPGNGIGVLNYATSDEILRSAWARVPYGLWNDIIGAIARQLTTARRWRITCPNGTDLRGSVTPQEHQPPASGDGFSLRNFPIGTHAPFAVGDANGRIALRWFASSQIHDVGAGLRLDRPVLAEIAHGRIVDLSGPAAEVEKAKQYLTRVGEQTGKDGFIVNSWHAGVNPLAFTPWRDIDDLGNWQTLTHNNPRTLHFHAVGANVPGELSLPIIDHTVEIDGEIVWEKGKLHLLDKPAVQETLGAWPQVSDAFALNSAIGV